MKGERWTLQGVCTLIVNWKNSELEGIIQSSRQEDSSIPNDRCIFCKEITQRLASILASMLKNPLIHKYRCKVNTSWRSCNLQNLKFGTNEFQSRFEGPNQITRYSYAFRGINETRSQPNFYTLRNNSFYRFTGAVNYVFSLPHYVVRAQGNMFFVHQINCWLYQIPFVTTCYAERN